MGSCIPIAADGIARLLPVIIAILFFAAGWLAAYLRQEKKSA